jgi:hypothetical protein
MTETTVAEATAEAELRLKMRAEEYLQDLRDEFLRSLPGHQSPAETLMFAHLMTSSDGYNDIKTAPDWSALSTQGFHSTLVFMPDVGDGICPTFAIRCRLGEDHRDLAILVDSRSPGERLPVKMMLEQDLKAREFKIVLFSEYEVLNHAEECRERVERILARLNEEMIKDSRL